jgi:hypothetical protein
MQTDIVGGDGTRGAQTLDDEDEQATFTERFDITVGHVVVEDKDSGAEMVQWKAIVNSQDIEVVSDSPTDAVMGAIEQATGGIL